MIAEIKHKMSCNLEDELTGNFFGIMRYLPFTRGLKIILEQGIKSNDKRVREIISDIQDEDFLFEFWKRSELGYGEIDGYMEIAGISLGIEVKYHSDLSGEDQLERESLMLQEWAKSGEKVLLFVATEENAQNVYLANKDKDCFESVHLAYITWQDIFVGLDFVQVNSSFERKMVKDLKQYLKEKGFDSFRGFEISTRFDNKGDFSMNLGENIHNAFAIVFETLKNIEKLIKRCSAELDSEKYYMPADRFMRYSSDQEWAGWIYWSFILLFQRKEDDLPMENGWINAPVYAVELNVDSETCEEPMLYIAKIDFGDISNWTKGCSPSNHGLFYDAIHAVALYEEDVQDGFVRIKPRSGYAEKVSSSFWGFKELTRMDIKLVEVTSNNYKEKIFGTIETLSRIDET